MGSTAISVVTALISGAVSVHGHVTTSGETVTITGPGGGALDFSRLVIRVADEATGGGLIVSIGAGTSTYSGIAQGAYLVTVATAGTAWIGGKDFESSRFLTESAQSLVLTITTPSSAGSTCISTFEAVQLPFGYTA